MLNPLALTNCALYLVTYPKPFGDYKPNEVGACREVIAFAPFQDIYDFCTRISAVEWARENGKLDPTDVQEPCWDYSDPATL